MTGANTVALDATALVDHLGDLVPLALDRVGMPPDCCIAATRIVVDVCAACHIPARPLAVTTEVYNPRYVALATAAGRGPRDLAEGNAWKAAGAHIVTIGEPTHGPQPGKWPGHLVAVVGEPRELVLVDLSLPQANRPANGIRLPAFASRIEPGFVAAVPPHWLTVELAGCLVRYRANPQAPGYQHAPDWRPGRWRAVVRDLVREIQQRVGAR